MTLSDILYENGNRVLIVRDPQPTYRYHSYYLVSMLLVKPMFVDFAKRRQQGVIYTPDSCISEEYEFICTGRDLIVSSKDVSMNNLPLYVSWRHTPLFDNLMKGGFQL